MNKLGMRAGLWAPALAGCLLWLCLWSPSTRGVESYSPGNAYTKSYECESRGDYSAALKAMYQMRTEDRSTYFFTLRIAWLHFAAAKYEDALTHYERAASMAPESIEAQLGRMSTEAALNRWVDAEKSARNILDKDPKNYTALSTVAYAQFLRKKYRDAKQSYEEILKLYPYDQTMQAGLGWSQLWLGFRHDGQKTFKELLAVNPESEAARIALGRKANVTNETASIYQKSYKLESEGQFADAQRALSELPEVTSRSYFTLLRQGWLSYGQAAYTKSAEFYGQAAQQMPDAIQPLLYKSLAEMMEGRWDACAQSLEAAQKLDARNYLMKNRLANAYYQLGKYAAAEELFLELARDYPSDLSVHSGLGWSLLMQRKVKEAAKEFSLILRVCPAHELAAQGLAQVSKPSTAAR